MQGFLFQPVRLPLALPFVGRVGAAASEPQVARFIEVRQTPNLRTCGVAAQFWSSAVSRSRVVIAPVVPGIVPDETQCDREAREKDHGSCRFWLGLGTVRARLQARSSASDFSAFTLSSLLSIHSETEVQLSFCQDFVFVRCEIVDRLADNPKRASPTPLCTN